MLATRHTLASRSLLSLILIYGMLWYLRSQQSQSLFNAHLKDPVKTPQEESIHLFKSKHENRLPRLYPQFLDFATANKCELIDWDWVDSMFDIFYEAGGITNTMIEKATKLPTVTRCHIFRRDSKIVLDNCGDAVRFFMNPFLSLLGNEDDKDEIFENLILPFNGWDEPQVLVPTKEYQASPPPYFEPRDVKTLLNVCAKVPTVKATVEKHGFLTNPSKSVFTNETLPLFSMASIRDCFADIVIPSFYALKNMNEPVTSKKWNEKSSILFWRGSSTGSRNDASDRQSLIENNHRVKLTNDWGTSPLPHIDIGMTGYQSSSSSSEALMRSLWPPKNIIPFSQVLSNYKYLLDIDGNSFSMRFLPFMQKSKSLILKMKLFDDWTSAFVRPSIDYVPVEFGSKEDLQRKLDWAMSNDKEAEAVAATGFERSSKRLRMIDASCYWFRILMLYDDVVELGKLKSTSV